MNRTDEWDADPAAAFAQFVRSPAFADTSRRASGPAPVSALSAKTYLFMFGKFTAWMTEHGKLLSQLNQGDLLDFINHRSGDVLDLNSQIAYRYLRLLERCYDALGARPNPATQALVGNARGTLASDAPTIALTDEELARFLDALPAAPARRPGAPCPGPGWKRRRDRALQLVMALAGLKVAETIGLMVDEIGRQADLEHAIEIRIRPEGKHDTSYKHTTILASAGVAELHDWLEERRLSRISGSLAFPSNRDGSPLHKSSIYRKVSATFERAGIDAQRAGGRTLRNTFAVQQLRQGASTRELAGYLGLARSDSALHYRKVRVGTGKDPA